MTSGTGIERRYQPGPLNRKTHQNSPLHLCLEVTVNEFNERLPPVHYPRDAEMVDGVHAAVVSPWVA